MRRQIASLVVAPRTSGPLVGRLVYAQFLSTSGTFARVVSGAEHLSMNTFARKPPVVERATT